MLTKYGFMMDLKVLSKKLVRARVIAGKKLGYKMKMSGLPKPMPQTELSDIIGVSVRKISEVESGIDNFRNKHAEKRAIEFIERYIKPRKRRKKKDEMPVGG